MNMTQMFEFSKIQAIDPDPERVLVREARQV
jgi:hypothetical protein